MLASKVEKRSLSCELNLNEKLGMAITNLAVVGEVAAGSQADLLGLKPGTQILTIAGTRVTTLDDVKAVFGSCKSRKEAIVTMTYDPPGTSAEDAARTLLVCS